MHTMAYFCLVPSSNTEVAIKANECITDYNESKMEEIMVCTFAVNDIVDSFFSKDNISVIIKRRNLAFRPILLVSSTQSFWAIKILIYDQHYCHIIFIYFLLRDSPTKNIFRQKETIVIFILAHHFLFLRERFIRIPCCLCGYIFKLYFSAHEQENYLIHLVLHD